MPAVIPEEAVPKLKPGVRLRFDRARDGWALLAPERVFQLDPVAGEVLRRVDGSWTLRAIIDDLAKAFAAPRAAIAADVQEMLADLAVKGALTL